MAGPIDLGALAAGYDHRPEGAGTRWRAGRAADAAGLRSPHLVVDVGGGRGGHAEVFEEHGARVLLVDRSPDMAAVAVERGIGAVVGDGAGLPVGSASARLVYFHLSLHHGDSRRWLSEAARAVEPGGLVWVWTLAHDHHRNSLLARWFPSVGPIDEARFPHPDQIARNLVDLGLDNVIRADAVEHKTVAAGAWEAAVRAGFVSTLQLLPEGELDDGLARFRRANPDPASEVSYSLRFHRVSATRPSLAS